MTQRLFLCGGVVLVLLAAITVHSIVFADAPTIVSHTPALGEVQPEASIGRYQIAVFGDPANGPGPGYYIIDTATGGLWMGYRDKEPSRIIGGVPSKASTPQKDQEASLPSPDKQVEEPSRREEIYTNATRTQVRDLCNALDMYGVDVGDYPSSDEGLQALVAPPASTQVVEQPNGVKVLKWLGPYLRTPPSRLTLGVESLDIPTSPKTRARLSPRPDLMVNSIQKTTSRDADRENDPSSTDNLYLF